MQTDVGWVLALVINNVSPHGVLHGAYFSPRGCGNQCGNCCEFICYGLCQVYQFFLHRQYSLSVFTLDCDHGIPNFHAVMCKAVSAEIRLVDLSGSNFHGHGFDGNPNFHRLRELFTGMFLAIH